jgi:hypothetical protein
LAGWLELDSLDIDLSNLLDVFAVGLTLRAPKAGLELFCAALLALPPVSKVIPDAGAKS